MSGAARLGDLGVDRGLAVAALALALCACPRSKPRSSEGGAASAKAASSGSAPADTEEDRRAARRKRACVTELGAQLGPRFDALAAPVCAEWIDGEIPGVALAIAEPNAAPIHAELGVRCFGEDDPVTPDTSFRLGSISKTVTAALVLGAVAEGRLERETTAAALPGFVDQRGTPTPSVALLLGHRSGLGDVEPDQLVEHEGAWLPALAASAGAGPVGSFYYSNSGYSLLGALVAHRYERSFAELVRERIAAPLALASLRADVDAAVEPACGHLGEDPDRHPISVREDLAFMPGDPSWLDPAGGVLASARDLARFGLALGTEKLPGTEAMLEPGELLTGDDRQASHPDERYGDGLRSWQLTDGSRAYGHRGNNGMFAAELVVVPGRRAIVVLSNCGRELPASVAAAESLLVAPGQG